MSTVETDLLDVRISLDEGLEFRILPVDAIEPDPDNPNVEDMATFNELVEGMKQHGVLEAVLVRPFGEGRYRLVAGEHRWKAAKLAGRHLIPALVKTDWTEDDAKVHLVRMNALRGRLDPERFTRLWEQLKGKFGEAQLRKLMGFAARDAEFRRLLRSVTKGLPPQMRQEIEKRADKIRRVEDLATVVQSLFARYGSTLDAHFVLFAFGGQTHLMVRADEKSFEPIRRLAEACAVSGQRLDRVLAGKAACECVECQQLTAPTKEAPDGGG